MKATTAFAVAETEDNYVNGNYWTALTDGRAGVAFLNRGSMGSVREPNSGFSLPLAFAMYSIWGTRMLNGEFSYDFFEGVTPIGHELLLTECRHAVQCSIRK